MTKHYCDMCKKELDEYDLVKITAEKKIYTYEEGEEKYELCQECMGKVRDLIIYGDESCQN